MIWTKGADQSAKFRFSATHVKFHLICTLIGSFCWKYIRFQLKKYRGVMSHDTEDWCKIWIKPDLLFQKWQEVGEFWSEHSKVSKICILIGPFRSKYITFDLKKYRWVVFCDTEKSCKIWWKTDLRFRNDMRSVANFHQSTMNSQSWDFDGILLSKVENICD